MVMDVVRLAKLNRALPAMAQGQIVVIVYLYILATNVNYAKTRLTPEMPATSAQTQSLRERIAISVLIADLRGQIVTNARTVGLRVKIVMNASTPNIPELSAMNVQMNDSREQIVINV